MKTAMFYLIILVVVVFSGCSEDDDPIDTIRYEWPTWSFQNDYVISRYLLNPQTLPTNAPITLSILNVSSRSEEIVSIPNNSTSDAVRFWLSNRENLIVLYGPELRVADFNGNIVNPRIEVNGKTYPDLIAFSETENAYYWTAYDEDRLVVGVVDEYSSSNLSPSSSTILLDTLITEKAEDIVASSAGSCAVLLSDGSVLSISNQGASLLYKSAPVSDPEVGDQRLHYLRPSTGSDIGFLYLLDAEGLKRINLVDQSVALILPSEEGNLLSFDVDPSARNILFVTSGSQVWLASENATPIQALLFEHTNASFSLNGTTIAAVGYVNGAQEEITLLQYRK